jgi:hypothetical protein
MSAPAPDPNSMVHVAKLRNEIFRRPIAVADLPLETDHETWVLAEAELRAYRAAEGLPFLSAPIDRLNFLLAGVPVVIRADG